MLAWLGFAVSVPLAVLVSFAVRFLVASTAFWLLDATGPSTLAFVLAAFFSGLTVPLVIFPGWTRDVVMLLPWATYIQVPADIWLGQARGLGPGRRARAPAGWAARAARRLPAGAAPGDPQGGGPGWLRWSSTSRARLSRHRP